jgi:hypothetical protein
MEYNKLYGLAMVVTYLFRNAYSKEIEYGLVYTNKDKEFHVNSYSYGLIPMENLIVVYTDDDKKVGSGFDDDRIEFSSADNAVEGQWDNLR